MPRQTWRLDRLCRMGYVHRRNTPPYMQLSLFTFACKALSATVLASLFLACLHADPQFRLKDNRLQITSGPEVIAQSPAEGLWSIACDWKEGWPAQWQHARPARITSEDEWTLVAADFEACGGRWSVQDAYRIESGMVRARRRWEWHGKQPAPRITLSIRFETPADKANILLPGIVYYGNPSGARSGRVPVTLDQPGDEALYEEHRFPMPFAFLEWRRNGRLWGTALHAIPSPVPYGNQKDQWWSLGKVTRTHTTELVLLSGPCASNGRRSVIKATQNGFISYPDTWLNLQPGAVIEKSFYLDGYPVKREGSGFQRAVRNSLALFRPFSAEDLPSFASIIRAKYRYALTRWREDKDFTVFQKYRDRKYAVMGWTGQAEAPGYALQVLAAGLRDPRALELAQKSLDFLSRASFFDGGFHNWFDLEKKSWDRAELLNQGQAMLNFARAIEVGRASHRNTSAWESFLRKASDLHSARILEPRWQPVSTAEAAFIAPLLRASRLFGETRYRAAAFKAAEHYSQRHFSMIEPYWGGTSDARSEDKEAAALAFSGFLELYETTHDPKHLEWARHACDVMLTYSYVWDVPLPPGRLSDHRLRTRGWTSVSIQNQHLDVWSVLTAPDVYRLGQIDHRPDLQQFALVMYRTCGQLIDPSGSQGEQLQQTNYAQRGHDVPLAEIRGGYNEDWTVFWITAHFLTGAARFQQLGVPIWREQGN